MLLLRSSLTFYIHKEKLPLSPYCLLIIFALLLLTTLIISSFNGNNSSQLSAADRSLPKWPLKPGVLVHVNTTHSLSAMRAGAIQISENGNADLNNKNASRLLVDVRNNARISYNTGDFINQTNAVNNLSPRATTTNQQQQKHRHNEMLNNNISKRSFCNDTDIKVKYKADNLEGVFHGKSGGT